MSAYETVIGLEVHAQLKTASKIFCGCPTRFGAEPNTQVCPVCLGLPGSLPVLNEKVIELAVRAGLALDCTIRPLSHTARKNYFYPDLPKGYQISQYDEPLCSAGKLEIEYEGETRTIGITRIHIEEDAGKSLHEYAGGTAVDFNRCGVGLVEIVSEPDLRSPGEARAYLNALKRILVSLGVSDGNMEEGSLRVDANLSLRPVGSTSLGTKTEVKNMNSFRSVEHALASEVQRQTRVLDAGQRVEQVTLLWNDAREEAVVMRSKEEAHDYRYFPEPDLVPIHIESTWLERIRSQLPELPAQRQDRFQREYHLNAEVAHILASSLELAEYFEAVIEAGAEPIQAAGWISSEVLHLLHERNQAIDEFPVTPPREAELLKRVAAGKLSMQAAKVLHESLINKPDISISDLIEEAGLQQMEDQTEMEALVQSILEKHPAEHARLQAGETKLVGFFMGQIMRLSGGRANPAVVKALLHKLT